MMNCLFNAQENQFNGLPTTMYQNQRMAGSVGDMLCHWWYCLYRINTLLCVSSLLFTQNTLLLTRLVTKCLGDFPQQAILCNTNWTSYSLTHSDTT